MTSTDHSGWAMSYTDMGYSGYAPHTFVGSTITAQAPTPADLQKIVEKMEVELKESNKSKIGLPLTGPTSHMSAILKFFRDMTLSTDDKLFLEMGLEDPAGIPTDVGLRLAIELVYKESRPKLLEIAKLMKAEKDTAAKK